MFTVYILFSECGNLYYKGFTTDIDTRLQYHLLGKSKFTSRYTDWKLVYTINFENKSEALKEEKRLKRLNRLSVEKLISG